MLTVIGSTLLLLLVVAGLMAVVGLRKQTATVVGWTIAVAIGVSFLPALWHELDLSLSAGAVDGLREGLLVVGVVTGAVLSIASWVKFVNHRRKFKTWLGEKPTSQKRRVDRE